MHTHVMILGAIIIATSAHAETVFECEYADGRVTSTVTPCRPGMVRMRVSRHDPDPPGPAAASPAAAAPPTAELPARQIAAMVLLIRASGYTCDVITAARPCAWGCDYTVACDEWRYTYDLRDRGGNWIVTAE